MLIAQRLLQIVPLTSQNIDPLEMDWRLISSSRAKRHGSVVRVKG